MAKESGQKISKTEADLRRTEMSYNFRAFVANWIGWILFVASFAVPLIPVYLAVDALAGQETVFKLEAILAVSLVIGGGGVIAGIVGWLKQESRKKELQRLRTRVSELEAELDRASASGERA